MTIALAFGLTNALKGENMLLFLNLHSAFFILLKIKIKILDCSLILLDNSNRFLAQICSKYFKHSIQPKHHTFISFPPH